MLMALSGLRGQVKSKSVGQKWDGDYTNTESELHSMQASFCSWY